MWIQGTAICGIFVCLCTLFDIVKDFHMFISLRLRILVWRRLQSLRLSDSQLVSYYLGTY